MTKPSEDSTDWIDVDTFDEFCRCKIAGQIAFRLQGTRVEKPWWRIPNLSYQPFFTIDELIKEIDALQRHISFLLGALMAEFVLAFVSYSLLQLRIVFLCWALLGMATIFFLCIDIEHWWKARRQLTEFAKELPTPLPENGQQAIWTHWWSLIKLGYAPSRTSFYSNRQARLRGKCSLVLEHTETGDLMPVYYSFERPGLDFNTELALRYRTKLLAMASLISIHESGKIRWGIVVDRATLSAIAIPLHRVNMLEIPSRAESAFSWLREQSKLTKELPTLTECHGCKWAYPRLAREITVLADKQFERFEYGLADVVEGQLLAEKMLELGEAKSSSSNKIEPPKTNDPLVPSNLESKSKLDQTGTEEDTDHDEDEDDDFEDEDDFDANFGFDDDEDEDSYAIRIARVKSATPFLKWLRNDKKPRPKRHSLCGDLFQWAPPHEYWQAKQEAAQKAFDNWASRQS